MSNLFGQASGGFTESSAALRILHAGVRNNTAVLTDDAFTQVNPPIVATAGTVSTSRGMQSRVRGILSGSVAFARGDAGSNFIGGPVESGITIPVSGTFIVPLGVFVNSAAGNPFENQPAIGSGKNTYVQSQGCYGNALYETQLLATTSGVAAGTALTYVAGMKLIASRNGYLMPTKVLNTGAYTAIDTSGNSSEVANGATAGTSTVIAVLKMAPDSVVNELIYDQRI